MAETRVLVAEDDAAIRTVFVRLLEGAGYRVSAFRDGDEAIARIEAGDRFDVAITDLNMPGAGGEEVIRALKARSPLLPVIVVTALHNPEAIEECFRRDAYRYLRKPFTKDDLLGLV